MKKYGKCFSGELEKISSKLIKKKTKAHTFQILYYTIQIWSTFFSTCEMMHLFETFLCSVLSVENYFFFLQFSVRI